MKEKIILIGGGGHCKSCIDVIEAENKYQIAGIIDMPDKIGQKVMGYSIIGSDDDLEKISKEYKNFIVTIGQIKNYEPRMKAYEKLKTLNAYLPVIISPNSYVAKTAHIGEGTIIMHRTVVNAEAVIGVNCIINTGAIIEHEAVIGDNTHVSTAAVVNGQTRVGSNCFIGSNAVLYNNIDIGDNVIVRAGSYVSGK